MPVNSTNALFPAAAAGRATVLPAGAPRQGAAAVTAARPHAPLPASRTLQPCPFTQDTSTSAGLCPVCKKIAVFRHRGCGSEGGQLVSTERHSPIPSLGQTSLSVGFAHLHPADLSLLLLLGPRQARLGRAPLLLSRGGGTLALLPARPAAEEPARPRGQGSCSSPAVLHQGISGGSCALAAGGVRSVRAEPSRAEPAELPLPSPGVFPQLRQSERAPALPGAKAEKRWTRLLQHKVSIWHRSRSSRTKTRTNSCAAASLLPL